jgi:hypothetical protein
VTGVWHFVVLSFASAHDAIFSPVPKHLHAISAARSFVPRSTRRKARELLQTIFHKSHDGCAQPNNEFITQCMCFVSLHDFIGQEALVNQPRE